MLSGTSIFSHKYLQNKELLPVERVGNQFHFGTESAHPLN